MSILYMYCIDPDGWNDWLLQWVAYSNWIYSRSFSLKDSLTGKRAYLTVDGLDTVAAIRYENVVAISNAIIVVHCDGVCAAV